MSESGKNAFFDFLQKLAPASVPEWLLMLAAALIAAAVALVLIKINRNVCARMERKVVPSPSISIVAALPALAAYPFAPHVYFADIEIGLVVMLAFTSLAAIIDLLSAQHAAAGSRDEGVNLLAALMLLSLALIVPVLTGGTLSLIEASRLQSDWFGMGWFVFKNPFGLPALIVFFVAAIEVTRRGNHSGMFLVSAMAAAFFLGGFESPLTWVMRKSLGEDPGFLNHVTMPDGSTQMRVAIGGFVFQVVCAASLIVKTWLGIFVMMRVRAGSMGARVERWSAVGRSVVAPLTLVCVLGAGVWEWARAEWWG